MTRFIRWGTVCIQMRRLVIKEAKTIRKRIHEHLREELLSGKLPPHQRLIEAKIAKEIGTSRTPVREALHSLELEGLIESIPRVGYVVRLIGEEEVEEICQIRAVIEGLAARWAIRKDRDELIRELGTNISSCEEKVLNGDVRFFVESDAQFHEILCRFSGSKRLLELAQTFRHHMLRYRRQSIYVKDNVLRAIEGHKGILVAIKKADQEEIDRAIRDHLEQSKKDIVRYAVREDVQAEKKELGC